MNTYQTQEFKFIEVELKGEKKYFVEGYISTIDADDYNDVVTREGQESLASQVKNKLITMDVEHEEFIENGEVLARPKQNTIPVAKIVDSELRAKGVWVKAEINKNSSRFKEVWGSIKDRFLHSFSIAFTTVKAMTKQVKGNAMRFIEELNLINVTLTGCPVNQNATFAPVMKAALKSLEETKMTEETPKVEDAPKEEVQKEEVKEEVKEEEKPSEIDELKQKIEEQTKKVDELLSSLEAQKKVTEEAEAKTAEAEAKLEGPLSQVKSLLDSVKKNEEVIADLKAQLNAPVLKAQVEQKKIREDVFMKQSPLDMI
jgi:HK97 family phage prohead protease